MSTIRTNPEQVTVSDPTVARQFARAVAQEQATGSTSPVVVTNSDTLFNQATAAAANAAPGETSTLTVTSSPANDAGDVVTVYRTTGGIAVTAVNETVNQYTYTAVGAGVTQIIAGNNVTITSSNGDGSGDVTINATIANLGNISTTNFDGNYSNVLRGNGVWGPDANSSYGNSNVASYLPTYTGNISSGNAALGNLVTANYANIAFDVNANVVNANYLYGDGSNITNLPVGNIASINLDGNASNVLRGDGTFGADANSSYGDSNVATLLGSFGSNNISTTGNISVGDLNVTGNVTSSLLPNANVTYDLGSNTQRWNDIWLANSTIYLGDATLSANGNSIVVDSITVTNGNVGTVGNVASLNLDGSNSNILYGNGVFAAAPSGGGLPLANGTSNINIATANGNVTLTSAGNTWTVGTDGALTAPNGSNIYPAGNNFNAFAPAAGSMQFYSDGGNFAWSLDGYGVMNLPYASALSNTSIVYSGGNFRIDAGANNFVFTDTGLLTMPGGNVSIGLQYGSEAILASNTSFGVATQGANVTTFINWSDDVANTSVMSAIYVNAPNANPGDIHFRVGNVGSPNFWQFNVDGNLVLPNGNSVIYSIANSSLDPTLPNVSTMTLTPDANYNSQVLVLDPTAPGHIHLRAYAFSNIDDPAANIFLGGENTAFEITSGANNEARIHSNNYTWTYGNDGNLTLPGNTFAVNYANGTQVSLNGLPAGSNNQIQFNSNGAFGASANYTFTDTVGGGTVTVGNELNLLGNGTIGTSNNNLNIQPAGNLVVTASAYNWTFDIAGNLTLPGNTFAVNYANGSQASAPLVDITDTNGLTTVYYPTFVENRTTGQIVRADVDLSYRTDTNTLTVGNIVANNLGNISSINIDGNVSNVLTGNGTFVTLPVINANTVVWSTAPVANTSNGTAGQAAYDSGGNLYVCVATDTWAKFTGATSW
jgi:hypothetical protein